MRKEVKNFHQCGNVYVKSFVENKERSLQRFQTKVQADLTKQEQLLERKLVKRNQSQTNIKVRPLNNSNAQR